MLFLCIFGGVIVKKIVYCPLCGRKVGEIDTIGTMAFPLKCKKCNKLVIYEKDTGEVKTMPIPSRGSSSGKRFY